MNYKQLQMMGLFLLITTFSSAQIQFESGTFEQVKQKAKEENKYIFIDVYATWCAPCKWMEKEVFSQNELGDYYNQHFINYKVDIGNKEGQIFARDYQVVSFPSLFFVKTDGTIVKKIVTKQDAKALLSTAQSIVKTKE